MKRKLCEWGLYLVIAIAIQAICVFLDSPFIVDFLKNKIVEILVTLMAINTATSSFIVSKLQDIGKEHGVSFKETYIELRRSLFEQIVLIAIAVIILMLSNSKVVLPYLSPRVNAAFSTGLIFVFVYAIDILRDTGVAMFNILIEMDEG